MGWIGQEFGARWSLIIGSCPTLICGLLALPVMAGIDRRRTAGAEAEPAEAQAPADRVIGPERTELAQPSSPGRS